MQHCLILFEVSKRKAKVKLVWVIKLLFLHFLNQHVFLYSKKIYLINIFRACVSRRLMLHTLRWDTWEFIVESCNDHVSTKQLALHFSVPLLCLSLYCTDSYFPKPINQWKEWYASKWLGEKEGAADLASILWKESNDVLTLACM